MKMEKQRTLPMKEFIPSLKKLVKPNYLKAMWPVAGVSIIFIALVSILTMLNTNIAVSLSMTMMMIMYGMASPLNLLFSLLEIIGIFAIIAALAFFYSFYALATQYTYQDKLAHPEQPVSAGSIWMHYKHLRKNQVWRIILYICLFTFLWSLPLNIINGLLLPHLSGMAAVYVAWIIRILNDIVVLWKSIEYSQSYFLYREKQPQFLGQSMRYALTASRRFMTGRKWNYFAILFVVEFIPMFVWSIIFGGLAYYGNYTATYVLTYIGIIVAIIGIACYLPVVYATMALYYSRARAGMEMDVLYKDTFKPVADLTGEAYIHEVYVEKQPAEQPSPVAKHEEEKKHEAKKDE
ncbi:hypothetical protein H5S09_09225 [Limosilactobacillus sp. STM2_1]|uniref:DUF975 family protein n=1 Tax=Limosilactobacillus rudii TaxID=2759755 RepID=A0A7W3YP88_9LACO|nr:hypothetical protein [Limosilactobacillus rudii]MBB1078808.1 hypothetical protein [Limosilactobacillus rudii]MBB1098117.1 hypothetical protein [Limosilactobacillus rudii]MCD7135187.1 hypothetical protein [Limosilactobacillus rudii]